MKDHAATTAESDRLLSLLAMDKMTLSSKERPVQSTSDRWMRYLGFPGGIAVFLLVLYLPPGAGLSATAQAGAACFALALVWWVTEPFPTYVTSLVLMFLLLITQVADDKTIMYVLGMDVIWLNLLAFILSSMLVKVRLAKRMAFWLILKFGKRSGQALFAFLLLHMILAPLIPATAARTVMVLPLMIVVGAIYGATEETNNNFGRNLMLLNLGCISVLSSMTFTGSAANLIAVGLIQTMADQRVYYMDWVRVGTPLAVVTMVIMWFVGQKVLFRIPEAEQVPQLPGGLGIVEQGYRDLGPLTRDEKKAIAIFALVLGLWTTDVFHMRWFGVEISAPFAALLGASIALLPRYGVLAWAEAEIPWHLLIFSAGAYAGGLALDNTGAAAWAVKRLFGGMDLASVPFGVAYTFVIAVMMYSHLLTTSKTVRTIIMIPIIITLAKALGWNPIAFALPAALCIDWVVGLPISGKPNVVLYSTNLYSVGDNFKYGMVTCTIGVALLVLMAMTVFPWIGLTPDFWAVHK
jgi:solute carrier family 13 (sodium-dependent dicarboxylate transporter), member 2/3/5